MPEPNAAVTAPAPARDADVRTVAFVSLGCPKNLVDSEKMLGLLAEDGLAIVPSDAVEAGEADAVVINTCGFLEASKEESLGEIRDAIAAKEAGLVKRVIVAGCLVQRHRAKLLHWAPQIDAMIGVFDRDRITTAVRGSTVAAEPASAGGADTTVPLPVYSSIAATAALARKERRIDGAGYYESDSARLRLTPRHYAYLRISEGCNQNCAFCTIPSIRGKMRSKPVDVIAAEMRELMADGAFEISLIGQDTTSFGEDIGYGPGLVGMLEAVNDVAQEHGGGWVRLMYAYPSCFTDAMIDAIARLPHVLPYIDIPLQHINDRVLDAMRRRTSRSLIETLLAKLRDRIPGMAIRTTFITGFPGETEAEHQELVQFVRDFGFDAMGVFPYSPEPGTPAGTLHSKGGAIDDDTIARRQEELMLAQQEVVFARNDRLVEDAAEVEVLIDDLLGEADDDSGVLIYEGRTKAQAPSIDATTRVQTTEQLAPGEVVRCQVIGYDGYDLVAAPEKRTTLNVLR